MTNTQSASAQAANDLLNGTPGFKFNAIGDTAKGVITKLDVQQETEFKTKKPRFFENGNPIMQIVITLRQDDGEEARIYTKPDAKRAIREAVQAAGAAGLEVGGRLALRFAKEEEAEPGLNPKKLFTAQYEAPTNTISANDLL